MGDNTIQYTAFSNSYLSSLLNVITKTTGIFFNNSVTSITGNLIVSNNIITTNDIIATNNVTGLNISNIENKIKYISSDNNSVTSITGDLNVSNNITCQNLVVDGQNISTLSVIPPGTIHIFAGNVIIPDGYLLCNGLNVSKTQYGTLWSIIGDLYLAGRPAQVHSFRLPDLRGVFIRGSQTNTAYTQQNVAGGNIGTFGYNSIQRHTHQYDKSNNSINVTSGFGGAGTSSVFDNVNTIAYTGSAIHNVNNIMIFGEETRPHCIAMDYIIKF
jgi:microcystin-dependent protein